MDEVRRSTGAVRNPQRSDRPELLDLGAGTDQDVKANLAEMDQINRRLGGDRALFRHLFPRLEALTAGRDPANPIRLLDLGAGSAGIPLRIAAWANKEQRTVQITALDWAARNLRAAAQGLNNSAGVHLLHADAAHLPVAPGQVDYVISSLFLHHLSPAQIVALLRAAYRLSNCGLVMTDLVRGAWNSFLPVSGYILLSPIFARNFLTYHDGILSIRRAYTPSEIMEMANQAGLPAARVYRHFPWRMTLVIDK